MLSGYLCVGESLPEPVLMKPGIVTYRPNPRQRLGKHIPAGAIERDNKTSIARQRTSEQAFSTIERLCFLRGPCQVAIKGQRRSFECCRELGRVLEMAVASD
jgi:hypothetical protein